MKTLFALLFCTITFANPVNTDPIEKRIETLDKMFVQLESRIANPAWLDTDSYRAFKKSLYSEESLKMSDEQLVLFINTERKKLPFTHFSLSMKKSKSQASGSDAQPYISWRPINEQTALLNVGGFPTDPSNMIKAVSEIGVDKYDNLIIDLRGNDGGSLDAGVILARFLTTEPLDAGFYLTRKWFDNHGRQATIEDMAGFPFLEDFTYAGITKMYQQEAFRMVLPGHNNPTFQGTVYVLSDNISASACEPLLDIVKEMEIATVVGERSNGAMLSAYWFDVNEDFRVQIPIADYQTARGDRLDKVGVMPDVLVPSQEALDHVLNVLIPESKN